MQESEMASTRWRLVCLCLLFTSWPAVVLGSPLPTATTQITPDDAENNQTGPLSELGASWTRYAHRTEQRQNVPLTTTNDHSLPLEPHSSTTTGTTTATHSSKDSTETTFVNLKFHNSDAQTSKFPCTNDSQCHPPDTDLSIPSSFVHCSNRTCVCNDCFVLVNDTCSYKMCHHFDNSSASCVDKRKSQKTLLILSVFLSSTGAANLYIGQEALGYAQLGLLMFLFLSCCCIYCIKKCCVECCKCFEDECDCCDCCEDFWICCHELGASLCSVLCMLAVILSCLAIIGWWAADITGFVENKKLDGNGCPLINDL